MSCNPTVVEWPQPRPQSSTPTKRWSILKNIMPFSGNNTANAPHRNDKPDALTIDTKSVWPMKSSHKAASSSTSTSNSGRSTPDRASAPDTPVKVSGSFRFSLEWSNERAGGVAPGLRNRRLAPPRLPHTSRNVIGQAASTTKLPGATEAGKSPLPMALTASSVTPVAPKGPEVGPSKYSGRALAEWGVLLLECQNFYERRRAEGVVGLRAVETPSLTVENFRKPAG